MQIKIERRQPVNPYTKKKLWQLRERIHLTAIVKYAVLILAGILIFRAGQTHALAERGYEALGGEVFALLLPGLSWMVSRIIRDTLDLKGGGRKW